MRVQVGRGMRGIRGVVGGRSARSRPCRGEARIASCSAQHPLSCCQSIFPYYCSPFGRLSPPSPPPRLRITASSLPLVYLPSSIPLISPGASFLCSRQRHPVNVFLSRAARVDLRFASVYSQRRHGAAEARGREASGLSPRANRIRFPEGGFNETPATRLSAGRVVGQCCRCFGGRRPF